MVYIYTIYIVCVYSTYILYIYYIYTVYILYIHYIYILYIYYIYYIYTIYIYTVSVYMYMGLYKNPVSFLMSQNHVVVFYSYRFLRWWARALCTRNVIKQMSCFPFMFLSYCFHVPFVRISCRIHFP